MKSLVKLRNKSQSNETAISQDAAKRIVQTLKTNPYLSAIETTSTTQPVIQTPSEQMHQSPQKTKGLIHSTFQQPKFKDAQQFLPMQSRRYDGTTYNPQTQEPITPMEDVQSTTMQVQQAMPRAPIYLPYYQQQPGYSGYSQSPFERTIPYGYAYNPLTHAYEYQSSNASESRFGRIQTF